MNIYEIAKKLIGETTPVGETQTDERRFENLKTLIDLFDQLSEDIMIVARDKDRAEHSISKAGKAAYAFLCDIAEWLEDNDIEVEK